jgi:hypothetical protein
LTPYAPLEPQPGLALVAALLPSYWTENQMAKATQSKKVPAATAQKTKASPRVELKKAPAVAAAKKTTTASPRKVGAQPVGKIAAITALLRRPKGASIDDLMKATGWQAHSVRGAVSASIKKKLGLKVVSEKTGTVRLYRIVDKAVG